MADQLVQRKSAKKSSKKQRFNSLHIKARQDAIMYRRRAQSALAVVNALPPAAPHAVALNLILRVAAAYYLHRYMRLVFTVPGFFPSIPRKVYIISSFNDEEIYRKMRFRKRHLRKLFTGLRVYQDLEVMVLIPGRYRVHREMLMIILLWRYANGGHLYEMYLQGFGDEGFLSRAITFAAEYLNDRFGQLIKNDLNRQSENFPFHNQELKRHIRERMGVNCPPAYEDVALAFDATRRGVGATDDPVFANNLYSGYTGTHCLGYLCASTLAGILCFVGGPFLGRNNDPGMLRQSNFNHLLMQAQHLLAILYKALGDRAFVDVGALLALPRGNNLLPEQIADGRVVSHVRSGIELIFGLIVNLWKFVDWDSAQKILLCPVALHWTNICLLTNCYSCLYGNNFSRMMDIRTPTLQYYLNFHWVDNIGDEI